MSVYNITDKHNDVYINLQAILSDGINTYAKLSIDKNIEKIISTDFNNLSRISDLVGSVDDTKLRILDNIDSAYLINSQNLKKVYLKNQILMTLNLMNRPSLHLVQ